jgi:hypothetical protein
MTTGQVSQAAAYLISHHRAAHGTAHYEPNPGRLIPAATDNQVPGDQTAPRPAATAHGCSELRALPHPCLGWEH